MAGPRRRPVNGAAAAALAVALAHCVSAQPPPPPQLPNVTLLAQGEPRPVPIALPVNAYTEVPSYLWQLPPPPLEAGCPWSGPAAAVMFTTAWTVLCVANTTAYALNSTGAQESLGVVEGSCTTSSSGYSQMGFPPDGVPLGTDHARDYHGAFATTVLPAGGGLPSTPPALFAALHGENKNELWDGQLYQNTINADVPATECFSGDHNGTYTDCWPAYNGLVSGAALPFTPSNCYGMGAAANATWQDLGVVAWPTTGFVNATGGKLTYGLRHPSVLVAADGYLYVNYLQNDLFDAAFWMVRSEPGPQQGLPATFMALNGSSGAWDIPALPAGLTRATIEEFFATPSPGQNDSRPLFDMPPEVSGVHMSMAALAGTPYYVGVYSVINWTACWPPADGEVAPAFTGREAKLDRRLPVPRPQNAAGLACDVPTWQLQLRISADLANWSPPVHLSAFDSGGWDAAPLQYPSLASMDGRSQATVAAGGFYLLGSCSSCGTGDGPTVQAAFVAIGLA
jgi:hypothetical protein